jgi:trimethylamine--corrinoid protein Co-methyltransferase
MVKQYIRGIDIDDETLAVDIIHRVGPGGHFMNQDHTLKHFRRVWYSNLFDRTAHEQWIQNGETQFNNRLQKQTAIVLEHQPEPLSIEILRELDRMSEHWQ